VPGPGAGSVLVDGVVDPAARVRIPFATLNRHGLVAGATGTGKTRTLQGARRAAPAAGVPVLLADVKGDLSGMSRPGELTDRIAARGRSSTGRTGAARRCWTPRTCGPSSST